MWKHEILEEFALPTGSFWKKTILGEKELKERVAQSEVFYFGDYTNYSKLMPLGQDAINVSCMPQLPFSSVIYEYKATRGVAYVDLSYEKEVKQKMAIMLTQIDKENINCICFYSLFSDTYNCYTRWSTYPISISISEQNIKDNNFQLFNLLGAETSDEEDQILSPALLLIYNEACAFTDVINCQNVVSKTVLPPEKLNRKRVRNGKLPLYSYKILEVVKGKPKNKDAGSVPWYYKSPATTRFHLCRGHFKTFTEDKPLFGKYAGTFWWNPQSRGNKELGAIEKEYSVKQYKRETAK